MTSKWGRFRDTLERAHESFEFPAVEFKNYNKDGQIVNGNLSGSYESIGSIDVEFVPPGTDTSVDAEGTHQDFTTSIRVPKPDLNELAGDIQEYGDGDERPTRVEAEGVGYEVRSVVPEDGSNMVLIRLMED